MSTGVDRCRHVRRQVSTGVAKWGLSSADMPQKNQTYHRTRHDANRSNTSFEKKIRMHHNGCRWAPTVIWGLSSADMPNENQTYHRTHHNASRSNTDCERKNPMLHNGCRCAVTNGDLHRVENGHTKPKSANLVSFASC